ncbi:MAG: TolB family protein, partial [Candidatus Aminicenantales bacterium]
SAKPEKLTQDLMQKFSPSISRDGAKAAFLAFGGAQASRIEVRVRNLRTGQEMSIPLQEVDVNLVPRLSPDGSVLAYQDVVSGKSRTYIIALGAGAAASTEICESCSLLDFFPGNEFALVQVKPNELKKINLGTGEITPLLSSPEERILDASLAPDGKWLAWLAGNPDGRLALRISPIEGFPGDEREEATLVEADYYLGSPAWSPNGHWLFYLSEKHGRTALAAQELDPRTKQPVGEEREVYASPESRFMLNFPKGNGTIGVAADRIIFSATELSGNIFLATPKKR